MAVIVLGVGASHSTLMNTDWDRVISRDGAERFRQGLSAARDRIRAALPSVAVIIGSNHFRGIWLDLVPPFTLGVGEVIAAGEAGTPLGPQRVLPEFAQAIAEDLVAAATEPAISARLQIDHGQSHAVQYLLDGIDVPIVPLVLNVFARPLPTIARCMELGRNLAAAIRRYPEELRVVVIASGGLSHRLPWPERWQDPRSEDEAFMVEAWLNGRGDWQRYDKHRREIITAAQPCIFEEFDRTFLDQLDRGELAQYGTWSTAELGAAAGNGGQELRTWLAMAAALDFMPGTTLAYSPMVEWLTGMAVATIPAPS